MLLHGDQSVALFNPAQQQLTGVQTLCENDPKQQLSEKNKQGTSEFTDGIPASLSDQYL